jgi:hypothetical protein
MPFEIKNTGVFFYPGILSFKGKGKNQQRVFNIFSHERNVNKTILRFHLTPIILAIVKKKNYK